MARKEQVAGRMAEAVVKRLVTRKLADVKDETRARELVRRILVEDLLAEEKLDADARALLLEHAKQIKDSALLMEFCDEFARRNRQNTNCSVAGASREPLAVRGEGKALHAQPGHLPFLPQLTAR